MLPVWSSRPPRRYEDPPMRQPATSVFRNVSMSAIAVAVLALTTFYLVAVGATPGAAAVSTPHASSACMQAADFPLGSGVVGMAVTPDDRGYWVVANDGYVAACGDATYFGEQTTLNAPIVGIAATP